MAGFFRKGGWEMVHPEAAEEFQEGLNAPVASGRVRAGTTEGGDNLPVAAGRGVERIACKYHF